MGKPIASSFADEENISLDVLFLHQGMQGVYSVFPMGFFTMLALAEKKGYRGRIVNLDVERSIDPGFKLESLLNRYRPKVIALDLHWYVHSFCQIDLARQVAALTDSPIILGGYTSSFFAKEILENHPYITAVIRGEGEVGLPAFLEAQTDDDYSNVPGMIYRRENIIIENTPRPAGDPELGGLSAARLDLLDHWEHYVSAASGAGATIFIYPEQAPQRTFFLNIGRGCSVNCSYCTAGAASVKSLFGRDCTYYRDAEEVAEDFSLLVDRGIETVLLEYYPYPADDDYFERLFSLIRKRKLNVGVNFGSWSMPSERFLKSYSQTFNPKLSCLSFSPESGSEKVRRLNKGRYYSNSEIYKFFGRIAELGIYGSVHFGFGFPGEDFRQFEHTLTMFDRLKGRALYPSIRHIPIEPGSRIFRNPKDHGVTVYWKTFADYYENFRLLSENRSPIHPYGYRTDLLSEADLDRMKIAAYRKFYLNVPLILQRLMWMKTPGGRRADYFKIGFAIAAGSAKLLNRWER